MGRALLLPFIFGEALSSLVCKRFAIEHIPLIDEGMAPEQMAIMWFAMACGACRCSLHWLHRKRALAKCTVALVNLRGSSNRPHVPRQG